MYFLQAYISQKLNEKYSPVAQNPAAMQSAKIMVFIFPVMMTVFSLNVRRAAAALLVYKRTVFDSAECTFTADAS